MLAQDEAVWCFLASFWGLQVWQYFGWEMLGGLEMRHVHFRVTGFVHAEHLVEEGRYVRLV